MNFQQLEYIVAVDRYRHFVTAARHCHVTQATLSMMIRKLEDELGVKIFDRSKHPVVPTETGLRVLEQARNILREAVRLRNLIHEHITTPQGDLRLGIIPTLAPYLLPLFLNRFLTRYPLVRLHISELTTDVIIQRLKNNQLDVGLLAVPLNDPDITELPLFVEEFVVFGNASALHLKKKFLLPADLDLNRLWLLEEGHCLRNQVINLCELKIRERKIHQFNLTASGLETLKKVVALNRGITILPYLALRDLSASQRKGIRFFQPPAPARQIGLVSFRFFVKERLLDALRSEIIRNLPPRMRSRSQHQVIEVLPFPSAKGHT
ncbi:MAG: LysR substrate-binding domain-containing protein [Chitinophagales bacterium]|nr:LysR substrate-binding domain-containing protein [Chitinophagales bacterium]MDW8393928.1 LysR substrate-binding domain-containing protein [Chitinophagales bacterium]